MRKETDCFDNPLYDALLNKVHQNVDAVMADLEKDWQQALLNDYQNRYPELSSAPDRPPPEVASVIWENELRSSVYTGKDEQQKKIVKQPVGYVDMSIIHYEQILTEEFESDDQVSWCVTQSYQPSVLHLLCRPALTSMAKTLREINMFRNRINEESYDRQKIGTEYFGILTCNPEYEEVARSQDVWYVCFDADELRLNTDNKK